MIKFTWAMMSLTFALGVMASVTGQNGFAIWGGMLWVAAVIVMIKVAFQ